MPAGSARLSAKLMRWVPAPNEPTSRPSTWRPARSNKSIRAGASEAREKLTTRSSTTGFGSAPARANVGLGTVTQASEVVTSPVSARYASRYP